MPKIDVTPLRNVSIAAPFGANPVTTPRDQPLVDAVAVREYLFPTITCGNRPQYLPTSSLIPPSYGPGERLRGLIRPGKPNPARLLFTANKRPHFITLDGVGVASGQDATFKGGQSLSLFLRRRR